MKPKLTKRSYLLVAMGAGFGVTITLLIVLLVDWYRTEKPKGERPVSKKEALFPTLSPHAAAEFEKDISGDCMIAGTVRNDKDTPVADALVGLRILWEPWADPQPPARIKTDKNGRFAFKGLTRDLDFQLWVYSPTEGIAQYSEPECGAETEMVLKQGAELNLRFIKPGGSSPGEVRFLLAGDLLWPAREGRTNKQGAIRIIGLEPGEYLLWAVADNSGYVSDTPIRLLPGKQTKGEIELRTADKVVITVLDAAGNKHSKGAIVSVAPSSTSQLRQVTTADKKGKATIEGLPENSYTVSIVKKGYILREATSLRPGDQVTLRLVKGGSVTGRVQLEDGSPVSGAEIHVEEERGGGSLPLPASAGRLFKRRILVAEKNGFPPLYQIEENTFTPGPVNIPLPKLKDGAKQGSETALGQTDEEGVFALEGFTAGHFVLGAKHPAYITVQKMRFSLGQGQTHTGGLILMRPGMTARIRIVEERGYPIPDAEITVYDLSGEVLTSATSGSDGFAAINGLPEAVRLEAEADDRVPAFIKLVGKLGTESAGEMMLPPADKTLFGRVIDNNGFGLPEVDVVARSTSGRLLHVLTTKTEDDGTFRLDSVGAGNYHVIAEAGDRGNVQVGQANFRDEVKLVVGRAGAVSPPRSLPSLGQGISPNPGVPGSAEQNGRTREWLDSRYPPENLGADPGSDNVLKPETKTAEFGPADSLPVTASPSVPPAPRGQGGLPITLGGSGKSIVVRSFQSGTRLAETGISRGDRILEVDGVPVKGLGWARKAIEGPIGSVVMLKVKSDDDVFVVVVQRVKVTGEK